MGERGLAHCIQTRLTPTACTRYRRFREDVGYFASLIQVLSSVGVGTVILGICDLRFTLPLAPLHLPSRAWLGCLELSLHNNQYDRSQWEGCLLPQSIYSDYPD
jgi:hypothetical protein